MNAPRTDLDDVARAWRVGGAPAGFADRVIAASEVAPAPRRSARTLVAATAVVVAIAAALLLWTWSARMDRGSIDAIARTTVELPMAVAVVEPGTSLEWNEVRGGAEVRQSSGRAFYRVEDGAVFEVVTPAGRVAALGTAFEVEVEGMHTKRRHIASGLAGVGIATAIVVTLYEGRVVVANDAGEVTLEPGETARARAGEPPQVGERESVAALKAELAALRREVDVERRTGPRGGAARAAKAGEEAKAEGRDDDDGEAAIEAVHKCAMTVNGGPGCPMLQPSQEVLERRADCGVVVWDRPSAVESPNADLDELADLADLDEDERAKLEEATRGFHGYVRGQFQSIYSELGGDPELASKLSTAALAAQIDELTGTAAQPGAPDHYQQAAELVSSVLAGRRPAPRLDELTPGDRHAYVWTAAGDMYEDWLATSLGAARARELRAVHDGWTGNRGMQGVPHCPDEE
jgi:hypothetical protein